MHEPCDVNTLKHLKQIISRLSVLCDSGTFEGIFIMFCKLKHSNVLI